MDLIISGDLRDGHGHERGAELWRVPFKGWNETHQMVAESSCEPRRFALVEGSLVLGAGTCDYPTITPGEVFSIQIGRVSPA